MILCELLASYFFSSLSDSVLIQQEKRHCKRPGTITPLLPLVVRSGNNQRHKSVSGKDHTSLFGVLHIPCVCLCVCLFVCMYVCVCG